MFNPITRYFEMLIVCRPFPLDAPHAMDEIEKMLKKLTGTTALVMVRSSETLTYIHKIDKHKSPGHGERYHEDGEKDCRSVARADEREAPFLQRERMG